jgi:superfamily II DNA or RNA helicase
MLALPTGFGKGVIIQRLLKEVLVEQPMFHPKILLVVGAKNILLDQNKGVLIAYAQQEAGTADYSVFPDTTGKVVLATWQSLTAAYNRPHGLDEKFGLVIIDEAHNSGTWKRLEILKELGPDAVVGLTATAYRSSGAYKWPNEYGFEIVDAMPLPECIMEGWLSPMAGISIDTQVLLPKDVRSVNGLNYRKLNKALRNHPHLFENIAMEVANRFLPSGMKTVIVVNRVEQEACVIARILKQLGYTVGLAVNQAAAKEWRDEFVTTDAIRRYKLPHGHPDSIQVLISPQVIGEGFDAPMTECVVWASPTMSALRYTQVVGRGTRICPGKKFCLIVDYVYMIENYGYSYNFAQFMPNEVMHELPGGVFYVGPGYTLPTIEIPTEFTQGRNVVSMFDLVTPNYPPAGDWVTINAITDATGKSRKWVETRIDSLGYKSEIRMAFTGAKGHYPPIVVDLLMQKVEEEVLGGSWRTRASISQEVGLFPEWVARTIKRLGIKAENRLDATGKLGPHYSPVDVARIIEFARSIPKAGDWLCLEEVAEALGRLKSTPWVQARLEELYGDKAEIRFARNRNQELYHYPPEAVEVIRTLQAEEIPAGTWMTTKAIAEKLGKSAPWVKQHLEKLYPNTAEKRLGKSGLVIHYPPEALEAVRKIAEEYPQAGDWMTIRQMAHELGRSEKWVRTHVEGTSYQGMSEQRVGRVGVIAPHYPPKVLQGLKVESGEVVPPAGTWLSPTQIAELLGIPQPNVQYRLKSRGIVGELRLGRSNRIVPHYPPSVVEELKKMNM